MKYQNKTWRLIELANTGINIWACSYSACWYYARGMRLVVFCRERVLALLPTSFSVTSQIMRHLVACLGARKVRLKIWERYHVITRRNDPKWAKLDKVACIHYMILCNNAFNRLPTVYTRMYVVSVYCFQVTNHTCTQLYRDAPHLHTLLMVTI